MGEDLYERLQQVREQLTRAIRNTSDYRTRVELVNTRWLITKILNSEQGQFLRHEFKNELVSMLKQTIFSDES